MKRTKSNGGLAPKLKLVRVGRLKSLFTFSAILPECYAPFVLLFQNAKNKTAVKLTAVSCAPVVEVKIKRPDTKYQLGFSVQNGVVIFFAFLHLDSGKQRGRFLFKKKFLSSSSKLSPKRRELWKKRQAMAQFLKSNNFKRGLTLLLIYRRNTFFVNKTL